MRIVFMGSPEYAAVVLRTLAEAHEVVGVYTNPDKVRSRGTGLDPTPVKALAQELDLPVFTPKTLRTPEVQAELAALGADVFCVAAYGKILPQEVLDIPKHGCVNVHASMLPRWRGAAPVQRAILAGDERLGVSIMRMEAGLDTGDFTNATSIPAAGLCAEEATLQLAELGVDALLKTLAEMQAGTVSWQAQDASLATYAEKIGRDELYFGPDEPAKTVLAKVCASDGAHPAKCFISSRSVTVLSALAPDARASLSGGNVQLICGKLLLGCADGCVEVVRVKPDGKGAMDGKSFAAGIQGIKAGVPWASLSKGGCA